MMDVNLNLYRTFMIVAKSKSFTEASEILHISPPAITSQIKNLENSLEVKLFYRENGTTLMLTKSGELLLKYVEEGMHYFIAGQKLVLDSKSLEYGDISMGVQSHIGSFYLMKLITEFNREYNGINIKLITETPKNLVNMLMEHKIDFIVDSSSILDNVNSSVKVEDIDSFETCLIVSKKIYESNKDFKDLKFILPLESSSKRRELEKIFKSNKINLDIVLQVETTDLIVSAVKNSLGVGYVVKKAVVEELENKTLFEIKTPYELPQMHLKLAYCENYLTTASKYFIENYIKK